VGTDQGGGDHAQLERGDVMSRSRGEWLTTCAGMDINDLDNALHEIEQMVLVAVGAHESMRCSDSAPGFFQIPEEESELLSFSVYDLLKRVKALRADLKAAGVRQGARCHHLSA
jgi:hypothetical protein